MKFTIISYILYHFTKPYSEEENMATKTRLLKNKIIEATIEVFNRKGIKFTMDDIAAELGMSKKTIYNTFRDKQDLFLSTVDYCFDKIKESEKEVLEDDSLATLDKLRRLLGVMPEGYKDISFEKLSILKTRYPKIFVKVQERLETGWEATLMLINQGIKEGVIRPVDTALVKTMFEATVERFFMSDVLVNSKMSYTEGLEEVVNILIDGIKA